MADSMGVHEACLTEGKVTASIRVKMMFAILVMTTKRRRLKPKPATLAVTRDPVLGLCKEEHLPTGTEQTLKGSLKRP